MGWVRALRAIHSRGSVQSHRLSAASRRACDRSFGRRFSKERCSETQADLRANLSLSPPQGDKVREVKGPDSSQKTSHLGSKTTNEFLPFPKLGLKGCNLSEQLRNAIYLPPKNISLCTNRGEIFCGSSQFLAKTCEFLAETCQLLVMVRNPFLAKTCEFLAETRQLLVMVRNPLD